MYTLYYSPGACSLAVHALLIESGAEFTLKKAAEHAAELKSHNPRAVVPTLLVDGQVLREGAAILTYICEEEKSPLLPAGGWARAKAQEWLAFANSTLHPKYSVCFGMLKSEGAGAKENPLYQAQVAKIQSHWDEVEQELASKDYLCGPAMTVADILMAVIANWSPRISEEITFGERTRSYLARVSGKPSYQKAMQEEGVQYQAAA